MPTQIPVQLRQSYVAAAIAALLFSLLAAVINGAIVSIIVWAYG
jgi:hypothetical protein